MGLDRPASLFGNRDVGARWSGLAQRGELPGPISAGLLDDRRLGIRCHDGQKRHPRIRSNFPSGLLILRTRGQPRPLTQLLNPPEGNAWPKAKPRGNHRYFSSAFHPLRRDGFREGGGTRSHLNSESRPYVCSRCLLCKEVCKSALGCLTYSRIWCLSRGKHNML